MHPDFRIFTEPQQGATYDDQLAVAQAAETLGFDAFFRSDHYVAMGEGDGLPGPTDSWVTLAGLARETSSIRLGTLVTSATFRWPGLLAIQVAQVDQMSGGRVELGLGTGWFEAEHRAYGVPFPAKRFGPFAEQLEIITGLWGTPSGQTYSFDGEHYQLADSPALPKPVRDIPIIIGGSGARRTPALAARYATEYNANFCSVEDAAANFGRIRAACQEAGRDPGSIVMSLAHTTAVGRDDAEYRRRAEASGRDPEELRAQGLSGTVSEVVDKLGRYREAGAGRFYFQVLDLADLDHLELLAREVVTQL
ncbi:LLM class F420-dependent oxidoreductase [Pseudactinotalea suaedae]|uniref:LLM class F420-dependent oxidoreductase n=1 Tax=Pseudactinotalea suaedae TaxID=1524924 RepID=UPI0012E20BAF|nr:LLM class F420-dependent oxidoreductase [Pseudactinotalea suaedae]